MAVKLLVVDTTLLYDSATFPVEFMRISLSRREVMNLAQVRKARFIFVEDGDLTLSFPATSVPTTKDAGVCVNAMRSVAVRANADSTFVLATVDGRVAGGFIEERFIQPLFSSSVDFAVLSPASASGLGEAIDALEVGRTGFEAKVLSGLLDVLSSIVYEKEEMLHLADGFQDRRLERMLDFMKSNLGRRLTLEQVASAGFVSLREASRLFERHLSSSPMKFFLSMRLEKARSLLERGDLPMADICQQTGFESVSHFSTSFRKAYSVTPSEYRSRFR